MVEWERAKDPGAALDGAGYQRLYGYRGYTSIAVTKRKVDRRACNSVPHAITNQFAHTTRTDCRVSVSHVYAGEATCCGPAFDFLIERVSVQPELHPEFFRNHARSMSWNNLAPNSSEREISLPHKGIG
jgi:hypothetical protein